MGESPVCSACPDFGACQCGLFGPDLTAEGKRLNFVQKFVRAFSEQDTTYITPNRYNWAFMLQNTNSFESYKLNSRANRQQLNFYSKPTVKVGPYFGWRWIFLGYTFDVNSLGNGGKSRKRNLS